MIRVINRRLIVPPCDRTISFLDDRAKTVSFAIRNEDLERTFCESGETVDDLFEVSDKYDVLGVNLLVIKNVNNAESITIPLLREEDIEGFKVFVMKAADYFSSEGDYTMQLCMTRAKTQNVTLGTSSSTFTVSEYFESISNVRKGGSELSFDSFDYDTHTVTLHSATTGVLTVVGNLIEFHSAEEVVLVGDTIPHDGVEYEDQQLTAFHAIATQIASSAVSASSSAASASASATSASASATSAEEAKEAAEAAVESISVDIEAVESAKNAAVQAKDNAVSASLSAGNSAANALQYKNESANSAASAASSAESAEQSKESAAEYKAEAEAAKNAANAYRTSASVSAQSALSSKTAAASSAERAAESAAASTQNLIDSVSAKNGALAAETAAVRAKEQAASSANSASASASTALNHANTAYNRMAAAEGHAKTSEAYAKGTRGGETVPSTDDAYHNNAKYYSNLASDFADEAEEAKEAAEAAEEAVLEMQFDTDDDGHLNVTRSGETTDVGRTVPLHKGDYDEETAYEKGDIVKYENGLYWYFSDTSAAGIIPTNTTYWKLIVPNVEELVVSKVSRSGDTMSGNLIMQSGASIKTNGGSGVILDDDSVTAFRCDFGSGSVFNDPYENTDIANKGYVDDRFNGADKAKGYTTYQALVTEVNTLAETEFHVGQDLYIVTLKVPDLWVSAVNSTSVPYVYTTDAALVSELDTVGYITVGYYRLSPMETKSVDLTQFGHSPTTWTRPDGTTVVEDVVVWISQS